MYSQAITTITQASAAAIALKIKLNLIPDIVSGLAKRPLIAPSLITVFPLLVKNS